jgi:VanZ family protein
MFYKFLHNWLVVIIWAGVIFFFSHQSYLQTDLPTTWDFALRKTAHVTEYFILNLLLIRALLLQLQNRLSIKKVIILAALFSVAYATSDEFHQGFIIGRNPSLKDVGYDSLGVMLSVAFYFIWQTWRQKQKMIK